ncbi:MAG: ABC transporter ATP-binding protein [Thermoanaerobaculia bacterium]
MSVSVRTRGVSKVFRDGNRELEVLRSIDLDIQAGEFVAIVGPSGAGKSTLLHILGTLDRPDAGVVEIDGEDFEKKTPRELAAFRNRTIGFIFQFQELLADFTALENIMIPGRIAGLEIGDIRDKAADLMSEVGMGDRHASYPNQLSGGERQRVALCRALLLEPRLLLADEPTGNLDPESGEQVFELMKNLQERRGTTALVVTHNQKLASRCGRILYLNGGVIDPSR